MRRESRKQPGRRVLLQVDDVEVSLRLTSRESLAHAARRMPVRGWLPFSKTERRVLVLLLQKGALSREQIATELDESVEGRLRGILATLVARMVLMVTTDGYQVNVSTGQRQHLLGWVNGLAGKEGEEQGVGSS
jgi:hypothetical protein